MWRVAGCAAVLSAACLAPALADNPAAKRVVSEDFGEDWPLTVYAGMVNCIGGEEAIFIGGDGVYAMNGVAKGRAEKPYANSEIKTSA